MGRIRSKFISFLLIVVLLLVNIVSNILYAGVVPGSSLTNGIIMKSSDGVDLYYIDEATGLSTNADCKAKILVSNDSKLPCYCLEPDKPMRTETEVNLMGNSSWINGGIGLSYDILRNVSIIYACGYNGLNGWGVMDDLYAPEAQNNINSNGNYQKFVATQCLIWEETTGRRYYVVGNSGEFQSAIDELRGRVERTRAFLSYNLPLSIPSYSMNYYYARNEAENNPMPINADLLDQTEYHFGLGENNYYPPCYNPSNATWLDKTPKTYDENDIVIDEVNTIYTGRWTASLDINGSISNLYIPDFDNIQIWESTNNSSIEQHMFSCNIKPANVYASFIVNKTPKTSANGLISFNKISEGTELPVRGASFSIYEDSDLTMLIESNITLDDGGKFTYYINDLFGEKSSLDSSSYEKTVYIVEDTPGTEIYINGEWIASNFEPYSEIITCTFSWCPLGNKDSEIELVEGILNLDSGRLIEESSDIFAIASIELDKVDQYGRRLSGAIFEIYLGDTLVGEMTDDQIKGEYFYNIPSSVFGAKKPYDEEEEYLFTIKEAVAPCEVLDDGEWKVTNIPYCSSEEYEISFVFDPSYGQSVCNLGTASVGINNEVVNYISYSLDVRKSASDEFDLTSVEWLLYEDYIDDNNLISVASTDEDGTLNWNNTGSNYLMNLREGDYVLIEAWNDRRINIDEETTIRKLSENVSSWTRITFDGYENSYAYFFVIDENNEGNESIISISCENQEKDVSLSSEVLYGEENKTLEIGSDVNFVDTLFYDNLIPDYEYEIRTMLVDKDSLEPILIDGEEIVNYLAFVPSESMGSIDINITIDTFDLTGKTIVVYEYLYLDGLLISAHEDPYDLNQTFYLPNMDSLLTDIEDRKYVDKGMITLVDHISYENLIPNEHYKMVGELVNEEGEPILGEDGTPLVSITEFVPTLSSGTVEVSFQVDLSDVHAISITAYETMVYDDKPLIIHKNIDDKDQTISINRNDVVSTGEEGSLYTVISAVAAIIGAIGIIIYSRKIRTIN